MVPINKISVLVQIRAWRCPGAKPLSEPMMGNSLTHTCVTRPGICIGIFHTIISGILFCVINSCIYQTPSIYAISSQYTRNARALNFIVLYTVVCISTVSNEIRTFRENQHGLYYTYFPSSKFTYCQ